MALGRKTGGRRKGSVNKTTKDVREAMALIVQGNIENVQKWLEAVPDPGRRLSLFLDLCEYHIPRLSRSELTGEGGGPLQIGIVRFTDPK